MEKNMPPRIRRQFSYLSYENLCINHIHNIRELVPNLLQLPGTHMVKHTRLNESLALYRIWLSIITTRHLIYHTLAFMAIDIFFYNTYASF
jgi:hypothetical protein